MFQRETQNHYSKSAYSSGHKIMTMLKSVLLSSKMVVATVTAVTTTAAAAATAATAVIRVETYKFLCMCSGGRCRPNYRSPFLTIWDNCTSSAPLGFWRDQVRSLGQKVV